MEAQVLRPSIAERREIVAVPAETPLPLARPERLASLDIFRGVTIAAMLLVNNGGIGEAYAPLEHAKWHGWTPTDLIFPFFLFIVGVAIPFSLSKRSSSNGSSRLTLLGNIWLRALALFMLGMLLTGTPWVHIDPVPQAYGTLRILHWLTYGLVSIGIIALMFPWRSRTLAAWLTITITIAFLALAITIHYANREAINNGLPANFKFGNGLFSPDRLRIPGVLQRIGVCYGIGATIALFAGKRMVLVAAILLMAGYSVLMLKVPYANHETGSLTAEDNLARRVDERVFRQHVYGEYPDPEGLISTLPSIATVLLGVLVGILLRRSDRTNAEKCAALLTMGVFVTILGIFLHHGLMPINKKIWTPSFTVFTAGMGMLGLGSIFYIADVRGRRAWALPFTIYGMNAIAAFVLSGMVVRVLANVRFKDPKTEQPLSVLTFWQQYLADAVHRFSGWLQHFGPYMPNLDTPANTSLAFALSFVLVILLFMSVLYVCRIFIKV